MGERGPVRADQMVFQNWNGGRRARERKAIQAEIAAENAAQQQATSAPTEVSPEPIQPIQSKEVFHQEAGK